MNRDPGNDGVGQKLERLYARTRAGIRPGLDSIRRLLAVMGNPERSFLSIHVAGTNGKGSTCAMIESILRAHGLRTGLYTSPHLVRFHERIRVAGEPVSDVDLERLLALADEADVRSAKAAGDRECTFFELATAMAFRHFADAGVQVAVIEVGMGGRWDATNTLQPMVGVITPVALDHMEYLGNDFASIASEKAGILKSGVRAVCSDQDPEARRVIEDEARRLGVQIRWTSDHVRVSARKAMPIGQAFDVESDSITYGRLTTPLSGPHQVSNTATAILAVEAFFEALGREPDPAIVKRGLAATRWPGRCQQVSDHPPVIVDGAHNPAGAAVLNATLAEMFPGRKGVFVISALVDKDFPGILSALRGRIGSAFAVMLSGERARTAADLKAVLVAAGISAQVMPLPDALTAARRLAVEQGTYVCVTGSLFLIGDVLSLLEWEPGS